MTDVETMPQLAQTVKVGAELLDGLDTEWARKVAVDALNMESGNYCVLGQLFGTYHDGTETLWPGKTLADRDQLAWMYGFLVLDDDDEPGYRALTRLWAEQICSRIEAKDDGPR